jgi:hypothetical protein
MMNSYLDAPVSPGTIERLASILDDDDYGENQEWSDESLGDAKVKYEEPSPRSKKRSAPRSHDTNQPARKKKRKPTVKPHWYVENRIVVPADKKPSESDPKGFDYLLGMDWNAVSFPYTTLVGLYKDDKRYYVFGRESEDASVIIMLKEDGESRSLEIFDSPTSIAARVIQEVQNKTGERNKARQSGFDYLKLPSFKMPWMPETLKNVNLIVARKEVEARIKTEPPLVRNSGDLYNMPGTQEITYFPVKQEFKQEYEYVSTYAEQSSGDNQENNNNQFSDYLQVPETFQTTQDDSFLIEPGMSLTNGDVCVDIHQGNLMHLPPGWKPGDEITEKELLYLQQLHPGEDFQQTVPEGGDNIQDAVLSEIRQPTDDTLANMTFTEEDLKMIADQIFTGGYALSDFCFDLQNDYAPEVVN